MRLEGIGSIGCSIQREINMYGVRIPYMRGGLMEILMGIMRIMIRTRIIILILLLLIKDLKKKLIRKMENIIYLRVRSILLGLRIILVHGIMRRMILGFI